MAERHKERYCMIAVLWSQVLYPYTLICTHTHTHTHTQTHTYSHKHTHTHTCLSDMHNNNVQSRVLCDWTGPGVVFHSPDVLGSRGGSCVCPCGFQRLQGRGTPVMEWTGRDLCPLSGQVICFLN